MGQDSVTEAAAPVLDDFSFYYDQHIGSELGDFLKRATPIKTITWSTADTDLAAQAFDPWYEFFNQPANKKKVDNFNFANCNLRLRFVMNATPFLAGLVKITYLPLSGHTPESVPVSIAGRIPLSQRHHVDMLPQCNSTGVMSLPFFYHKSFVDITSAQDLRDLGRIRPVIISGLKHAQNITASINITCYAEAENLHLSGPTAKLAVQSSGREEYGKGPVEKMATSIANIASVGESIPSIAPFATATSSVASGVSWVASLFGWTNVPVIDDVQPYKSLTHHSLASAYIGEPVEKLTLDPKNELTVDPRTVGLDGTDELALENIVGRKSFVTSTTWNGSDPVDKTLLSLGVVPTLYDIVDSDSPQEAIYSTPVGHLSWLFKNWHGDLIYTFEFINTQYHKGRVRITWDPSADLVTTSDTTNTCFTQIVDLGKYTQVKVRCKYMQATPWLETPKDISGGPWFSPSIDNAAIINHQTDGFTNGTITVRVLNELTGPSDPTSCAINVYVEAAENFTFGNPRSRLPLHSIYPVQSSEQDEEVIEVSTSESNANSEPYKNVICMGEQIKSLRTLLRRSTLSQVCNALLGGTETWQIIHRYMTSEPLYYGFSPQGVNTATGLVLPVPEKFNFVQVTPYNWVAPLFLGRRGSMFWHFDLDSTGQGGDYVGTMQIQRRQDPFTDGDFIKNYPIGQGSNSAVMRAFNSSSFVSKEFPRYGSGCGGAALTAQQTQAGLSVGLPMYSNYRMYFNDWNVNTTGQASDSSNDDVFDLSYILRKEASTSFQYNSLLSSYASIGTDFNFFYFVNVPVHYTYNQAVPAAV